MGALRVVLVAVGAAVVVAAGASPAAAADPVVPFPSAKAGPVFVAAQTVTGDGTMRNYFVPGDTVVFRAYAIDTKTKKLVAAKNVRFFYVKLPGQANVKLSYDPSAPGATKGMPWVGAWTIPASYSSGTVAVDVRIKLTSHRTGQFVQIPVNAAQLTVSASPPPLFRPAPTGAVGPTTSGAKLDLSLYVDTVNGTRPVGAAPRQVGCTQTNVFKRGEQVVFRVWGQDLASGDVLSTDNVDTAYVTLAGQPNQTLNWGGHGAAGAKAWYWTAAWIVPADYPLGETTAHVVYKTTDGKTGSFDYAVDIIP